jgi:Zn ribbon nucleic-acid-binding protein
MYLKSFSCPLGSASESLILFENNTEVKYMVYIKGGASAQKENTRKFSVKEKKSKPEIQFGVNIGDQAKCPECETLGRVVWVSQDRKTMGVQCSRSHHETRRPESKFGATAVSSTKTKKNVVFLTPAT